MADQGKGKPQPGPFEIVETSTPWTPPSGWEPRESDAPLPSLALDTERTQIGKWLIVKGSGYTPGVVPQLTLAHFPGMPDWVHKPAQERAHDDGTFTHYDFFQWFQPTYPEEPEVTCNVWAHDGQVGASPFAIETITAGHLYVLPWTVWN